MWSNILDRISFWSLFATIVLLPIFFLPFTKIPVETSKTLLLVVGLTLSIICWAGARFTDGKIILPKSWLLVSGLTLFLSVLLSAIFSTSFSVSFFGIMFDLSSASFMLSAFLLMFFSSIILMDRKRAQMVLLGVMASLGVVLLFQIFRFMAPNTFALGILGGKTDNLFGSWGSFGMGASFLVVCALFGFEFFGVSKIMKWLCGVCAIVGILLLISVNSFFAWILLGIFALIIFVFKVAFTPLGGKEEEKNIKFPVFPFVAIIISLLFVMSSQFILGTSLERFGLINSEVTPDFQATMNIAGLGLKEDPAFGIGANRFEELWVKYKPASINSTNFFSSSFAFGSGLLPTFIATNGIVGLLMWLAFLVLFIIYGIKMLFSKIKLDFKWEVMVFFLLALFLFVSLVFYSGGPTLFLLAFAFTGIFIGLSSYGKSGEKIIIPLLSNPKKSFFSILLLVVLMVGTAATCFKFLERFASVAYFGKAITASSIEVAESNINKALSLHTNDLYFRNYAQVYFIKLQTLMAKVRKGETLTPVEQAEFKNDFTQAVNGANSAILANKNNPINFEILGAVYGSVVPFGVEGAYDSAIGAYTSASTLDPLNPRIRLSMADVSVAGGKIQEAKGYVAEALSLKSDYADAIAFSKGLDDFSASQNKANTTEKQKESQDTKTSTSDSKKSN